MALIPKYETRIEEYSEKYSDFLKFRREDGILEVRMHSDNGPLHWGAEPHHGLIPALFDINADPLNEIVILTGTGDGFLCHMDRESWERFDYHKTFGEVQGYDLFYKDQVQEPFALLNLQIPVICAINGPIHFHAELALLNDIVIASDNTYFYEHHWDGAGVVPGDGVNIIFRELLGHNRGRYFMLMGEKIHAQEALKLGLVGEVVPREKLLDRAWQIAREKFMTKNRVQRRLTRAVLMQPWRELFAKELHSGMAHEVMACFVHWPMISKSGADNLLKAIEDKAAS